MHFKVAPLYLEITDSASQMENKRGALRFEENDAPPTTAATTTTSSHPPQKMDVSQSPPLVGGCVCVFL